MDDILVRNWWAVALRGVAGILFGLVALLRPGVTLAALVLLFAAYVFVDGVFTIIAALRRTERRWWVMLLEGVADIAVGIVTVLWPGITALLLLYLIAVWAIVTGALEIATAIRLRTVIRGEWLLPLAGIASLLFGLLLLVFPRAGALAIVLWIGAYVLVFGVVLVVLAFRLRSWGHAQGVLRPV